MVNYKTLFSFPSFECFLIEWEFLNGTYDVLFKEFMGASMPSLELKTSVAKVYEKIKYLNKYGYIVYPNQIAHLSKTKKIRS